MELKQILPHLNAFLNLTCTVFLVLGYVAIRRGERQRHARWMVSAFVTSVLFLISYVIYHIRAGHTVYPGQGTIKIVYLTILFSHIVLAAVTVPLVLTTVILAWRGRFERHRRIARWTFPIWVYVSITGVVVYLMLYHFA